MISGFDFYEVKSGDQLFTMMQGHYGYAEFQRNQNSLLEDVLLANPEIEDINYIQAGQIIALPIRKTVRISGSNEITATVAASVGQVSKELQSTDSLTRSIGADLNNASTKFNAVGGTYSGLKAIGTNAAQAYSRNASDVTDLYKSYKAGNLSSHHYYKNRSLILDGTDKNLGILRRHWNGTPSAKSTSVLRMSMIEATRSASATKLVSPMKNLAKRAGRGGGLLNIATVGMGINDAMNAETPRQKTVILAETAGSTVGGIAGAAFGVFAAGVLVSNPVGWSVLVFAAVGGAAVGYLGEEFAGNVAEEIYDYID